MENVVKKAEEVLNRLKEMNEDTRHSDGDVDDYHHEADFLLCELLEELGYKEISDEFNNLDKWYA